MFLIAGPFLLVFLLWKRMFLLGALFALGYWNFLCGWFLGPFLSGAMLFLGTSQSFADSSPQFFASLSVLLIIPVFALMLFFFFRKEVGSGLALLFLLPALFLAPAEQMFVFAPLLDTTKSPEFSLEKFDRIQAGMTRAEVEALIGKPPEEIAKQNEEAKKNKTAECEQQTGDGALMAYFLDFAWLFSSVCYDEGGNVIDTERSFHFD